MRVGLNAHRFHHNSQECLNPLCTCSVETEDTTQYLLHCHYFSNQRIDLMNSVNSVVQNFEFISENNKKDLLLFGGSRFDENKDKVNFRSNYYFYKKSLRDLLDLYLNNIFNACFCPILNL